MKQRVGHGDRLADLVGRSEDRLINLLRGYILGRGYARYTSTLEEAWRLSIATLSRLLVKACHKWPEPPELSPDEDYAGDPLAAFAVVEAQRHRERGVDIGLFLGLLKYYRQSYLDLVLEAGFEPREEGRARLFVERFFDRIELGIVQEWTKTDQDRLLAELRAANRQMTNEKNRYLTIFESLATPAILINPNLAVDNMNQAAAALLSDQAVPGGQYYCAQRDRLWEVQGETEGAAPLAGQPLDRLFPWLAAEVAEFAGSTQPGLTFERQVALGESRKFFEVRLSRLLDLSRKFNGVLALLVDVTGRREAEAACRQSEENYRLVIENSHDGVVLVEGDRYIFANRRCAEMLGYDQPEEIIGQTLAAVVHPEDLARVQAYTRKRQMGEAAPSVYEFRGLRRDGSAIFIEVSVTRAIFRQRPVSLAILRDVTERKKAEEEIIRARDRAQQFLDVARVIILALDQDGRVTLINRRGCEVLGLEEARILGRDWFGDFLPERIRAEIKTVFRRLMAGEAASFNYFENPVLDAQGRERLIAWGNTLLRDNSGQITGTLSSGEDITEQQASRQEKERLEAHLRQSQKMEAIGTLAGGIAHDFNNILGAIGGYSELALLDAPAEGLQRQNLEQVLRACERAKDLVKQILAFSRQSEQEKKPIRIDLVVKEALKLLRASLPTTIEIRKEVNPLTVLADPTQVHQVLMNLCANAAHAMGERGGLLEVGLVQEEVLPAAPDLNLRPGAYARLTVSDSGCGMSPEVLDRIFDPFFTTKPKGEGTGLGLAVVHGIVLSHEGAIQVSSQPGQGTTFKIYLPLAKRIAVSDPAAPQALPTGAERILLVDDEPALVAVVTRMLEHLGYRVAGKTDGLQALEAFQAKPEAYDLLLTDYTMPALTGSDLARMVHARRPDLPIILTTGYSDKVSLEAAQAVGIKLVLDKPLVMRDLAKAVRRALDE